MSFANADIDLTNLGVALITGENRFEPLARSNGSGKSAIIESILWNLTGSTSRGSSNVANNILNRGVAVTLEFSIDNDNYVVTRSKNHYELGSQIKIIKNDEDISGTTQTKSKSILEGELHNSLDYDKLTSIIILSQGLPGRLSILKPASRKSRLEELSSTDTYIDAIQSKLNSSIEFINRKMMDANQAKVVAQTKVSQSESSIISNKQRLEEQRKLMQNVISDEDYQKYQAEKSNIESIINNIRLEISKSEVSRSQILNEQSIISREINTLTAEIKRLIDQYNTIGSGELPICPTCHQVIQSTSKVDELKSEYHKEVLEKKTRLAQCQSELPNLNDKVETLVNQQNDHKLELAKLESRLSEINPLILNHDKLSNSQQIIEDEIIRLNSIIEENKPIIESQQIIIDKYTKDLGIANYLKNQISRKFRSYLLEGIIKYMNMKCLEYSDYLFSNQGKVSLAIEGNNIKIRLGDRDFEDLSGGEGRRVDIILQLVQRDLARNESGFSTNLLVLDEILDNLDSLGAESVLKLLEYKSPDVSSMLIVTHKSDVVVPNDNEISIIKDEDQISHMYLKGD